MSKTKRYNVIVSNESYSKMGKLTKRDMALEHKGITIYKLQQLAGKFMIDHPEACGFTHDLDCENYENHFLVLRVYSCNDDGKLTAVAFIVDEVG